MFKDSSNNSSSNSDHKVPGRCSSRSQPECSYSTSWCKVSTTLRPSHQVNQDRHKRAAMELWVRGQISRSETCSQKAPASTSMYTYRSRALSMSSRTRSFCIGCLLMSSTAIGILVRTVMEISTTTTRLSWLRFDYILF